MNFEARDTILLLTLRRFIFKLKKSTCSYKYNSMEEKNFDIINDKSYAENKQNLYSKNV